MSNPEPDKPYTLTIVDTPFYGRLHNENVLKEGLRVGDKVGIRLLERSRNLVIVQFFPFEADIPLGTGFREEIRLYTRYHYQQTSGLELLIRAHLNTRRASSLRFDIKSAERVYRVRDLG